MTLNDIFESIAGQRIPGGCDDCSAWQEMTRQHGIYVIEISHDDTCPFLAQHQAITCTTPSTTPTERRTT